MAKSTTTRRLASRIIQSYRPLIQDAIRAVELAQKSGKITLILSLNFAREDGAVTIGYHPGYRPIEFADPEKESLRNDSAELAERKQRLADGVWKRKLTAERRAAEQAEKT